MTFWLMIKVMIYNLMNKSFNTFDSHELNDFLRICHVLMTLILFFKNLDRCILIDFEWSLSFWDCRFWIFWFSLMLMIRRERWKFLRSRFRRSELLSLKTRRLRRNVRDSWKSADFASRFVMFDTRKNLSIALSRIKRSFWYFLS
jgi:hypothetical protein